MTCGLQIVGGSSIYVISYLALSSPVGSVSDSLRLMYRFVHCCHFKDVGKFVGNLD